MSTGATSVPNPLAMSAVDYNSALHPPPASNERSTAVASRTLFVNHDPLTPLANDSAFDVDVLTPKPQMERLELTRNQKRKHTNNAR